MKSKPKAGRWPGSWRQKADKRLQEICDGHELTAVAAMTDGDFQAKQGQLDHSIEFVRAKC